MTEIRNRVALVTGGGSGIGRGLAMALAAEGAAVVVADILAENARAVADEIKSKGGSASWVACDVSDRDAVKRMKKESDAALGDVSLVFANAGATSFKRLTDMTENDVDWIIQVNLMGVTNCMMVFLPDMIARQRGGHVCATASVAGLMPGWVPNHAPYSAAKMGVIGMMMNLGMELAEYEIGSTVYCPGGVATGMKENNALYRPKRFGGAGKKEEVDITASIKRDFKPPKNYTPEQIAPMVLRAIKNNHSMVLDHSNQRETFEKTYLGPVMSAFDEIAAYERSENW